MSAIRRIASASPPTADLPDGVAEGLFLTQLGHRDAGMFRRWGSFFLGDLLYANLRSELVQKDVK